MRITTLNQIFGMLAVTATLPQHMPARTPIHMRDRRAAIALIRPVTET